MNSKKNHKQTIRRETKSISLELQQTDQHPLLKQIYANRSISMASQMERSLSSLLPYHSFSQMDRAVDRLYRALKNNEIIVIFGDYDVDGATSTVLALRLLKAFGADHLHYVIPDRFEHGYGLTPEIFHHVQQFNPTLVVTVDNGITSLEGVAEACAKGVDVIITDHHMPLTTLPNAVAIVNPNQPGDAFASKNLAGVGVIFYVMLALRAKLREVNWFEHHKLPEPNLAHYLDLVALGTMADVVPLDQNNRTLVYHGLQRIRKGLSFPGILALMAVANRNISTVKSSDLSYAVAPRLNAAGRLEHMSLGIECLLTDDSHQASELAHQLNQLNEERRAIEKTMQQEAMHYIRYQEETCGRAMPFGICLRNEKWHAGVIGIVAARIKEYTQRPVIVFTHNDRDSDLLQGSARSIKGLHIRELFDGMAGQHRHLIKQYGGHAMAAGITIPKVAFSEFSHQFNSCVKQFFETHESLWEFVSDGALHDEDMSLETVQLLRESGPWGQDFPEPAFDGKFKVLRQTLVGKQHLRLVLLAGNKVVDAIAFHVDTQVWPDSRCDYVEIGYRLDSHEFQSKQTLQLIIEHLEKL